MYHNSSCLIAPLVSHATTGKRLPRRSKTEVGRSLGEPLGKWKVGITSLSLPPHLLSNYRFMNTFTNSLSLSITHTHMQEPKEHRSTAGKGGDVSRLRANCLSDWLPLSRR